jgi:hypothetical protein
MPGSLRYRITSTGAPVPTRAGRHPDARTDRQRRPHPGWNTETERYEAELKDYVERLMDAEVPAAA